jgi:NADH-quinone oxidoreductase subunit J
VNIAAIVNNQTQTPEAVLFFILAPIMVLSALGMLIVKKAVHSALLLAVVMVGLAILYIANEAPFLGIVQIVVYTGAVMMLFLFILMLVGVDSSDSLEETIKGQRIGGVLGSVGVGFLLISLLSRADLGRAYSGLDLVNGEGNVQAIAKTLFTRYVWAFEVISALLITAALGAMVLAHRERILPRKSQRELAAERVRQSAVPVAGLPAPGTYAQHNAVDIPALLPDGTPADASVSKVIAARGELANPATYRMNESGKDKEEGEE